MSPENELKATLSFELDQIRKELAVLDRMAGPRKHLGPDEVIVRAAASSLHSIYNGIEKMLQTVLRSRGQAIATGPTSHADLLDAVVVAGVIPSDLAVALRDLMAFRHFFRHSYGFMIDHELLNPLIGKAADIIRRTAAELNIEWGGA